MAQQQDPNGDPARGMTGQSGIVAGSQDTYRAKGFTSPNVTPPSSALSSITTAPTPATVTWGKYSGPSTPGIQAAIASGGSGQPGTPNAPPKIGALEAIGGIFSSAGNKPNNSPIQDIGGALYQGLPISDQSWAMAGYGPGGATLTPQQQQSGLRSITAAPMAALLGGPAAAAAANAAQQPPLNTMPPNAILRPY